LLLCVEADTESGLERIRDGIARRIEKVGRRDSLGVTWTRAEQADLELPEGDPTGHRVHGPRLHGRGTTMGLMAGGAVVVAVHLGLGGATPASSGWTGWAADAILIAVLIKLAFMGGHLTLGRVALRRGKAFRASRRPRED
jgi:hypothetical protein